MTTPATYKVTRKKTSKPTSAMRVLIAAPEPSPEDAADAVQDFTGGGAYFFEPGQSHAIPGWAAAAFMADAYHAEHFDIEPALPKAAPAPAADAGPKGKKAGGE